MARARLSEFRAKRLIVGDTYDGFQVRHATHFPRLRKGARYVVKVDQGVKRRAQLGLMAVNIPASRVATTVRKCMRLGYDQVLVEPYLPHHATEERYLSLERTRGGLRVLYGAQGGVAVESRPERVETHVLTEQTDLALVSASLSLPHAFFAHLVAIFNEHHFSFLEINPFVVSGAVVHVLDAAVLVDATAAHFVHGWSSDDLVSPPHAHIAETHVAALQRTSSASFSLRVLTRDAGIFFLLSGGGGSLVAIDTVAKALDPKQIGNYGEYSGGATREETYLYTREILSLLLASRAKKRALVITGAIANFTDIRATFDGVISALEERAAELHTGGVRIFVRRGGPNEASALARMETFLAAHGIRGYVCGSAAPLTAAVEKAITYIQS